MIDWTQIPGGVVAIVITCLCWYLIRSVKAQDIENLRKNEVVTNALDKIVRILDGGENYDGLLTRVRLMENNIARCACCNETVVEAHHTRITDHGPLHSHTRLNKDGSLEYKGA